jgi:DNA modification methylase
MFDFHAMIFSSISIVREITVQKPAKLIERLVKASSSEGDVVYDPFSGSGTVPAVCAQHDRRFVACELNSEYAKLGRQRVKTIREAGRQLSLL